MQSRFRRGGCCTWAIWVFWWNRGKVLEETEVDHSKNIGVSGYIFLAGEVRNLRF